MALMNLYALSTGLAVVKMYMLYIYNPIHYRLSTTLLSLVIRLANHILGI